MILLFHHSLLVTPLTFLTMYQTHTHTHKELHTYRWTLLFPLRQSLALAEAKNLKYHLEVSKQRVKTPKAAFSQKSGTEEPSACRYCGLRRVH